MSAYLIVELGVHDAAGFEEYRLRVPELIRKHGGEYIVRGGATEVIAGWCCSGSRIASRSGPSSTTRSMPS